MRPSVRRGALPLSALLLAVLAACSSSDNSTYQADIRRTSLGVPHIRASDWGGLGYGFGYAQAEDNLCTMADSFLTYRGERSKYFGGDALGVYDSTIDRPKNLDSDFFHRHLLTNDVVDAMAAAQPDTQRKLVDGFVAGYNRYLRDLKSVGNTSHAACRNEAWVQPITARDLWRRLYQTNLAGGHSNFLANIANAAPPAAAAAVAAAERPATVAMAPAARTKARAGKPAEAPVLLAGKTGEAPVLLAGGVQAPRMQVGGTLGIGSNMYGFGTAGTGSDSPVMFGNPHWYWKGPDRFYQAQLTIPGEVNVSGVSFLGVPNILIGFNENVAWSHTVSTARRFGFFQLTLAAGDTTSYMRDGRAVKMTATPITVDVKQASGTVAPVTRTLYKSEFGPLINLAALNPALAWNQTTAFAIRDINADNFRTFRNWLGWSQAKSLDEFIAIQRREAAIPWVNTVAVGKGSARAWYADIGAVPNVSADQIANCTTPFGRAIGAALPNVPFFDGSRAACDWLSDADSVQKGAVGPARMPSLQRDDYVGNMNDSYWLSNARAPLTGFPPIFGTPGTQSLRTRLGHTMALQRLDGTDGYAGNKATPEIVREMVLNSRVFSAERFKAQTLDLVCATPTIAVAGDAATGETFSPPQNVDVAAACTTLRAWNNTGTVDARGSHVWDEFWNRVQVPAAQLYNVPFDAADPLNTPRDVKATAADALKQAFGAAVRRVGLSTFAVNAPRGDVLFAQKGGAKIPLYGGCGGVGYFTITCSEKRIDQGGYSMDDQPHGNTYMQVVSFPASGVEAHTFLTFSLSDDPASPRYRDYTVRYGAKNWLRVPFTEAAISADADLKTTTIGE